MRLEIRTVAIEERRPAGRLAARCPECAAPLAHEAGCAVCRRCGYAACG